MKGLASGVKERYHPTAISAYALYLYNQYATDNFLKYANWLVDNLVEINGFYAWAFDFSWRAIGYKCDPPWISSMTQGMDISVLVRAYELTNNDRYLTAIDKALTAFEVPVSEKGLLRFIDGDVWYEGTPSPTGTQVLNEVLFALIGLHEASATELFNQGFATIKKHLKDFDLNLPFFKWSRYDNGLLFYSGNKYHEIHIQQLKWLHIETGDYLLLDTAFKWQKWQRDYNRYIRFIFTTIWSKLYIKYLKKRYLAR